MDTKVANKPTYATVADDLRRIADLFEKAADVPLDEYPWIHLDLQPSGDNDEQAIDRTDRLGAALFGKLGAARKMGDGSYHYDVEGMVGAVRVHVFDGISEATVRERERLADLAAKEAELERLRAEVAELRAQVPAPVPSGAVADEPGYVEGLTCGWCPDPMHPDPARHPGNGREHRETASAE